MSRNEKIFVIDLSAPLIGRRPAQRARAHDGGARGEPIAAVGNSGLSTGPHLHYEVHVSGKVVDPLTYVLPGAIPD
jgi:Peptidase family M23